MPTHSPAEPGSARFRYALDAVSAFGAGKPLPPPPPGFDLLPLPLTPRQLEALRVLVELTDAAGGVAPTLEEMACELDMASKSAVSRLLTGIEERGWITRMPGKARAVRILRRPRMPDEPVFVLSPALAPPEPPAAA